MTTPAPAISTSPSEPGTAGVVVGSSAVESARFFPGQLVGPDDLNQDQSYFRDRLRRHNRLLHGWGIVCGAGVTPGVDPQTVVVGSGLVLDPWGNEIWLETDVVVDLCHTDLAGNLIASAAGTALPASTTTAVRAGGDVVHLAVRHLETNTNPVRIPGTLCSCDNGSSEHSRVRDACVFGGLGQLPDAYDPMPQSGAGWAQVDTAGVIPCPPMPRDPWVILGDVTMTGPQEVGPIDLRTRRRHVLGTGDAYFLSQPRVVEVAVPDSVANSTPFPVTVTLDAPSANTVELVLTTDPPIVSVPSPPPSMPRGQASTTFQIATQSQASTPVQMTLSVTYLGSTQTAVITVAPGPVG